MSARSPRMSLLAIAVMGLAASVTSPARAQETVAPALELAHFVPEPVDDILFNPHMGMYMASPPLEPQDDEWYLDICDIAYYRQHWSDLNPEEGVYTFDEYFAPIFDYWVKQRGKRVAFGPMSMSRHARKEYVTPKWVFDKGVPGVDHVGLYVEHQFDPVFWDERYLDLYCEFVAKLGEYLDGREGFEFIDMRGIGEWGEMHLQRWTPEQLEATGYTDTKYIAAYRRMINAYVEAFPHSLLFLNVGSRKFLTIMDYAAAKGCHFRQDGLSPAGASNNVGEWLYKPYSRRGVICNFEFNKGYRGMQERGWGLPETIDAGLRAPVSYWNTNLCRLSTAPDEVREQLTRAARRIGYRFVLTDLAYLPEVHADGEHPTRLLLFGAWRNDGVAPCYDSFALCWELVDAEGKTVASSLSFPETPTTQWWPGEEVHVASMVRIPADVPPGRYRLKMTMLLPETGRHILLGIAGRDGHDRYDLVEIRVVEGASRSGVVYEEGFEGDARPWGTSQEMAATIDDAAAHTGERSMLVSGSHERGWN
ncbi:MAG: DUF4832 domain-containing protein, partial [Armatimonadetes bacterium]|nr:DUF4832 domain-containing protein [Armatimonadota bacterium]